MRMLRLLLSTGVRSAALLRPSICITGDPLVTNRQGMAGGAVCGSCCRLPLLRLLLLVDTSLVAVLLVL